METTLPVCPGRVLRIMPRHDPLNLAARRRAVAWLKWWWAQHENEYPSRASLARALKLTPPALTFVWKDARKVGLDFVLNISRLTGVPLDTLVGREASSSAPAGVIVLSDWLAAHGRRR